MSDLSDKNMFIILLCVGILFFFIVMPYLDNLNLNDKLKNNRGTSVFVFVRLLP